MARKNIEVIGGGTVFHVRNHLALTAPAYGHTAKVILDMILGKHYDAINYNVNLHLTKMANQGQGELETNQDVENLVDKLIANPDTKIIFFNVALVDYEGSIAKPTLMPDRIGSYMEDHHTDSGKYETRLQTSEGPQKMLLYPAPKLIAKIRNKRKDIFLVGFKTTCGETEDEQFLRGLHLLKSTSCNLVLANDTKTRNNMVITPEQARYFVTTDRKVALQGLVDMAMIRSKGTFTRSKVMTEQGVPWSSSAIPETLRKVVNHCIAKGAYKPFNGSTVGHFAVKRDDEWFITSKRKADFNKLNEVGMVECRAIEPGSPHYTDDTVYAYGGKPSVGGQSQRIVFKEHPEMDCIVHFHCPPKKHAKLSVRDQSSFECGSHECGQNTSTGLRLEYPGIKCVYLDNHGPNIVFNREVDPEAVIDFIDHHFDLSQSTDGIERNT